MSACLKGICCLWWYSSLVDIFSASTSLHNSRCDAVAASSRETAREHAEQNWRPMTDACCATALAVPRRSRRAIKRILERSRNRQGRRRPPTELVMPIDFFPGDPDSTRDFVISSTKSGHPIRPLDDLLHDGTQVNGFPPATCVDTSASICGGDKRRKRHLTADNALWLQVG